MSCTRAVPGASLRWIFLVVLLFSMLAFLNLFTTPGALLGEGPVIIIHD